LTTSWVGVSAVQIARAVRRGDTAAAAVLADHVEHARLADRVLTALRVSREAAALAEAEQVDELAELAHLPLAGVPVLVQENVPVAGLPTWRGTSQPGRRAERDHEIVRRLRGAGAVVLGLARMSEHGLWPMTDDDSGITHNPWRSDRGAGGAAGGAACAVAAGIVPIAHGVDTLGGVRIAAASCGVLGFKPGRGVVPYESHGSTEPSGSPGSTPDGSPGSAPYGSADDGLTEHGVLATTVADLAAGFAVLAGRNRVSTAVGRRLRVAVSPRNPLYAHGTPTGALVRVARLTVACGHDVVRADPPRPARLLIMAVAAWAALAEREPAEQGRTQRQATAGALARRRHLVRAGERADWRERCEQWFARGYDVLLTPALGGPPPPAVAWSARSWPVNLAAARHSLPYVVPWSLAGLPALVLPAGPDAHGLPTAVQLVGPPGAEERLLALAAQLESADPWPPHAPGWPRSLGGNGSSGWLRSMDGYRSPGWPRPPGWPGADARTGIPAPLDAR
jgi:amidase